MKKKQGFTLLEVMVAGGISLLLGLVLVGAFVSSSRSLDHATGNIDLVRATRAPMERISKYLASASTRESTDAILYPTTGVITNERGQTVDQTDASTWPRYVIFRTTEDFLDPNFDPDEIYEISNLPLPNHQALMDVYRTSSQDVYDYILWWEDSAGGFDIDTDKDKCLMLGRVTQLLDSQGFTVYRDLAWADIANGGNPFADLDPNFTPLAVSKGSAVDISFFLHTVNVVSVSVEAETKVRNNVETATKKFRANTQVVLPSTVMSGV